MDERMVSEALTRLGFGGILAFAIRCARRVFPLTGILSATDREKIDRAIHHAELMLGGTISQNVPCMFASHSLAQDAEKSGRIALANAIHAATSAGFLAE